MRINRIRYVGHVVRMGEERHPIVILEAKTKIDTGKRKGRPRKKWTEDVEADLRKVYVRRCKLKAQNLENWRRVVKEAEIHLGLQCNESN